MKGKLLTVYERALDRHPALGVLATASVGCSVLIGSIFLVPLVVFTVLCVVGVSSALAFSYKLYKEWKDA